MDLVVVPGNLIRAATHGKGVFETVMYSGTLPVVVNEFTGLNKGAYNEIKWKVSQESSLSHYILERSTDGLNFLSLTRVNAANSFNAITYTHQDVVNANQQPTYYYRLKMVNIDGSYEYSGVVMIRRNTKEDIAVAGNPFSGTLMLRYNLAEARNLQLSLYDISGRLITRSVLSASAGSGILNVNNLDPYARGTYLLHLDDGNRKWDFKVVKN